MKRWIALVLLVGCVEGGSTPGNYYATAQWDTSASSDFGSSCSAVAISAKTVMTAAHCVRSYDDGGPCDPDVDCVGENIKARWSTGKQATLTVTGTGQVVHPYRYESMDPYDYGSTDLAIAWLPPDEEITGVPFPAFYVHGTDTATSYIAQGGAQASGFSVLQCVATIASVTGGELIWDCVDPVSAFLSGGDSGGPTYAIVGGAAKLAGIHSGSSAGGGEDTYVYHNNAWASPRVSGPPTYLHSFGNGIHLSELWLPDVAPTSGSAFAGFTTTCAMRFRHDNILNKATDAVCRMSVFSTHETYNGATVDSSRSYDCYAALQADGANNRIGSCEIKIPRQALGQGEGLSFHSVWVRSEDGQENEVEWGSFYGDTKTKGLINSFVATQSPYNADQTPPTISAATVSDATPAPSGTVTCTITTTDPLPSPDPPGLDVASGVEVAGCVLQNASGDQISCLMPYPGPTSGSDWTCDVTVPASALNGEVWTFKHSISRDRARNLTLANAGDAAFTVTVP